MQTDSSIVVSRADQHIDIYERYMSGEDVLGLSSASDVQALKEVVKR